MNKLPLKIAIISLIAFILSSSAYVTLNYFEAGKLEQILHIPIKTDSNQDPICTQLAVQHLMKYSNIQNPYFDGDLIIATIGLPNGLSQNELDDCADFMLSHHNNILDMKSQSEENLQWLLDHCACQQSGQVCTTAPYQWENSTHRIDNNQCEFIPKILNTFEHLKVDGKYLTLQYDLTNANTDSFDFDQVSNSLIIHLNTDDSGVMLILIPRELYDYPDEYVTQELLILHDGEEIAFIDSSDDTNYIAEFNFTNTNPEIEFIGTWYWR